VHPDYGSTISRGFLDFYVESTFQYGIEIMREGENISSHMRRFDDPAFYGALAIKDCATIDFRVAPDASTVLSCVNEASAYQGKSQYVLVALSADFSEATMYVVRPGGQRDPPRRTLLHVRNDSDADQAIKQLARMWVGGISLPFLAHWRTSKKASRVLNLYNTEPQNMHIISL
jgi:hypothetical protein